MATEVLRPNADVVAGWTELPAGAANVTLDDAVLAPTDAAASGDGGSIATSTAGAECEVHVGTFTLGTDVVSAVRLKMYCTTGAKRGIDWRLLHGTTELAAGTRVGANQSGQWYTVTYTGTLTQAQIDDLRAEFVCVSTAGGGGAGSVTVYAAYIEVDHAGAPQEVGITPVTESDSAVALSFTKPIHKALTAATESDQAQALAFVKPIHKALIPVTETDVAVPLSTSGPQSVGITPVTETDQAQPLTVTKRVALTPVTESDQVQALTVTKPIRVTLAPVVEQDVATALTWAKPIRKTLTAASEADNALALSWVKPIRVGLSPVAEVDEARPLVVTKPIYRALTPAGTSDQAVALGVSKARALVAVGETDSAQSLSWVKPIRVALVPATETDSAVALVREAGWPLGSDAEGAIHNSSAKGGVSSGEVESGLTGSGD